MRKPYVHLRIVLLMIVMLACETGGVLAMEKCELPTYSEIESFYVGVNDEIRGNYLFDKMTGIVEGGVFPNRNSSNVLFGDGANGYIDFKRNEDRWHFSEIVWRGEGHGIPCFRALYLGQTSDEVWEILMNGSDGSAASEHGESVRLQVEVLNDKVLFLELVMQSSDKNNEWYMKIEFSEDEIVKSISLSWRDSMG